MTRDETTIHDDALANYPSLIATLIRQRTLKIVRRELEAQGVSLDQLLPHELRMLAEAYFERHRASMIKVACDTVRVAAGRLELAEREARERARAQGLALTNDAVRSVRKC
jgi:hypothetical protein